MKIVFLDVDGVLNMMSISYYSMGWDRLGNDPIEPHLMARLEFIIERVPGIKIVVSSSWGRRSLVRKLIKSRFKYLDLIIDSTPRKEQWRGDQIKQWLDETTETVESYVVLEDEISDVSGPICKTIPITNVIEVDMNEGLSNKNCIDAIKVLLFPLGKKQAFTATEQLTSETYDKYYNLGFRPQVGGTKEELLERWSWFEVHPKSLIMHMKGNKDERKD